MFDCSLDSPRINQLRHYYLIRTQHRAFHPNGDQKVLCLSTDVFALLRISPEGDDHILALINVTDKTCPTEIPLNETGISKTHWHDLLSEREWTARDEKLCVSLAPYDVVWLEPCR